MLNTLQSLLAPAAMGRATLVVNHVLASEPAATERLRAHAGRRIELLPRSWPGLLPPPPPMTFAVTPAGLLEWVGSAADAGAAADLSLRFDASNPARLLAGVLAGDTPEVDVDGDAQLAGDVNWLMQNLRWDVEADLERVLGPVVARQLYKLGSALTRALRRALQGAASLRPRG
jgi:ubiquinone biosynthesis protein UbiJ